jgi:hypothetical protein
VHASTQFRNLPHGEVAVPQATAAVTHLLPGPTEASEHSSHDSELGKQLLRNAWMKSVNTGDTRTLAPTFVQSGSPKDVMPATRKPAGVLTSAGPPESPEHAPFRSVWV